MCDFDVSPDDRMLAFGRTTRMGEHMEAVRSVLDRPGFPGGTRVRRHTPPPHHAKEGEAMAELPKKEDKPKPPKPPTWKEKGGRVDPSSSCDPDPKGTKKR